MVAQGVPKLKVQRPKYKDLLLVHVVGLAPTKDIRVRLIYSQVPLLLGHTCNGSQVSNLVTRFQIHDPFMLKNR